MILPESLGVMSLPPNSYCSTRRLFGGTGLIETCTIIKQICIFDILHFSFNIDVKCQKCQMSNYVKYQINVKFQISNIKWQISNLKCQMSNHSTGEVLKSVFCFSWSTPIQGISNHIFHFFFSKSGKKIKFYMDFHCNIFECWKKVKNMVG